MKDEPTAATTAPDDIRLVKQAGAICLRRSKKGELRVLLVGSSRNGRGGLPEGHIEAGEASHAAAARETFEEAGIRGRASSDPFGSFEYSKDSSPHRYRVTVHLVETTSISGSYPEKYIRKKQCFPIEVAITQASQPGLRDLLGKVI